MRQRSLFPRYAKFGSEGKVSFENGQVDGPVVFEGAQFGATCSFEAAQIKGNAIFRSNLDKLTQTRFLAGGNFRDVSIAGTANFIGVEFQARSRNSQPQI